MTGKLEGFDIKRTWIGLGLVVALLAAACGGGAEEGGESTSVTTASETTTEDGADTSVADQGDTGEEDEELDSLADYIGFDFDDPDATAAYAADLERQVEESVASCMAQEGFEYVPVARTGLGGNFAFDEEEYAKENGFGITTWYGREDVFFGEEDGFVDPNLEITQTLSPSELEAYQRVLYGDFEDSGAPDDGTEIDIVGTFAGQGCSGQAFAEVYGAQFRVFEELGPQFEELIQRVEADPRYLEAEGLWSECMADRGYIYGSQEAMYDEISDDFQSRLDEITGEVEEPSDPFAGMTDEEVESLTIEEMDDLFDQSLQESRADIDQDALAALQQEEIDLAVAAFECGEDLDDVTQEIFREYEADFVRDNRAVLEQLRS